jgi:hypothetical protein
LNGFSRIPYGKSFLFVKHFNIFDNLESEKIYEDSFNEALKSGVPAIESKLNDLIKDNCWSDKKESLIRDLEITIDGLKKTKSKLIIARQRKGIEDELKKTEKELDDLVLEKRTLLGYTAEVYASKRVNEYYMFNALYKNKELKDKVFSEEEFEDLEQEKVNHLIESYNEVTSKLSIENIQRIAVSPFFINFFYLCNDDPYIFYGKPIINLTFYQVHIFELGKFFKAIISDARDKVADSVIEDPERLLEWYESNKNAEKLMERGGKNKQNKDFEASSIVGASKQEYKELGMDKGNHVVDIAAEAQKRGGLKMEDIIKLHGLG